MVRTRDSKSRCCHKDRRQPCVLGALQGSTRLHVKALLSVDSVTVEKMRATEFWWCSTLLASASAVSIAQINGINYLSPYAGQNVENVTGIVTAKNSNGLFIRGVKRACDKRYSNGLFIFGSA